MFGKIRQKTREYLYLDSGIYIDGNREITVENCRRIEEYNDIFIQIVSGELRVRIWGNNLRAYDFKTSGIIIRGIISNIELSERSRKFVEK